MTDFPSPEEQKLRQEIAHLRRELATSEAEAQLLYEFQRVVGKWDPQHKGKPGTCWQERPGNPACGLCLAWREYERKKKAREDAAK